MPAATSEDIAALASSTVVVHPLVLLSVVDHAARAARATKRRVVGILLGQIDGKKINVANSFAGELTFFFDGVSATLLVSLWMHWRQQHSVPPASAGDKGRLVIIVFLKLEHSGKSSSLHTEEHFQ